MYSKRLYCETCKKEVDSRTEKSSQEAVWWHYCPICGDELLEEAGYCLEQT